MSAKRRRDPDHSFCQVQGPKQGKTGCPEKWVGFCSSCYFLSEESKSWDEAIKFCRARGADLVVINSKDENVNIPVWIGLTDKVQEGTWKWVDGSPLTLFWEENQPDNGGGSIRYGEEDCAEIRETSGSWNDIKCETSMRWICEKEATLFKLSQERFNIFPKRGKNRGPDL
uniref:C-type lectin domain-containing protein n=1 Tax=Oryzias latipes TaxID=8090 RepID=A0A3P9JLM1_ORYLA